MVAFGQSTALAFGCGAGHKEEVGGDSEEMIDLGLARKIQKDPVFGLMLADQGDRLRHLGGLHIEIEDHFVFGEDQGIFEGGDRFSACTRGLFRTEKFQGLKFCEGLLIGVSDALCRPVQGAVVEEVRDTVEAFADIDLNDIRSEAVGFCDRFEGIFGSRVDHASMPGREEIPARRVADAG